MYLFIVFCKELLCVSIPFWLKDFHLCVYIFRFPPSLTLFSFLYQCCLNRLISKFHPIPPICAPNYVSSLEPLCSWLFAVRCTSKRGDFYVTFSISTEFTTMHNGASLMSSDPNGLLMPSGQMVSIEVWSNPNLIQQWDKPSSRWKGSAFEIGSETWSSGRIEVSVVFCVFSLFAFRLRFLDLISNKWKSLKNV